MISCAGQATIPIVKAIVQVQAVGYAEIVASLPRARSGRARAPISTNLRTPPSGAIVSVGGARRGKALSVINPADPPVIMRNTINCLTDDEPDQARIIESVLAMIEAVREYVPGYRVVNVACLTANESRFSWKLPASATYRAVRAISTS